MFVIASALAGFYHPSDIAANSVLYAKASEHASDKAGSAKRQARSYALALTTFEEALDLMGEAAPSSERKTHASLNTDYNRQFAVVQAFVDEQVTGFDTAFVAAMERALKQKPGAVPCAKTLSEGSMLPGMPARTRPNPDCKGEDLNAALAKVMDADPVLRQDVETLNAATWPTFELDLTPFDAGPKWTSIEDTLQKSWMKPLRTIRRADEEGRADIYVALENDPSKEELERLRPLAQSVTDKTRRRRATLVAELMERAAVVEGKQGIEMNWCARPAALGGCLGEDATAEKFGVLSADKKFSKLLP